MPSLAELYYLAVAILIFLIICCGRKRRLSRLGSNSNDINIVAINNNNTSSNIQPSDGLTVDERVQQAKEDRRLKILTTVMHKKAKAKPDDNDNEELSLPHMLDTSQRSSYFDTIDDTDEEAQDQDVIMKDDIFVDLQTLRSSRRVGVIDLSEHNHSTLYSPKSCPICLESYKDGDDICWSYNEQCPHAYHLDCIMDWLMEHDDCPLCRQEFLKCDDVSC